MNHLCLWIEHERLRQAVDAVVDVDLFLGVEAVGLGCDIASEECACIVGGIFDIDAHEDDVLVTVALPNRLELRRLRLTWYAPTRPEIQHDNLSPLLSERESIAAEKC